MDFDTYWKHLIDRVYQQREVLSGAEELVYRLTCIYGETIVDGIEAYFERRCDEYERDIAAMNENGFADIATDFAEARSVLFGNAPLTEETINPVLDRLLRDDTDLKAERKQINAIYDRLIDRLPELLDRRDEIGALNGLFDADGG